MQSKVEHTRTHKAVKEFFLHNFGGAKNSEYVRDIEFIFTCSLKVLRHLKIISGLKVHGAE